MPYVREMVKEAIENLGSNTTRTKIKDYIEHKYSSAKKGTVECTIICCTVNDPLRIHYSENKKPRIANDSRYDFLFSLGREEFEMYSREKHGIWEIRKNEYGKLEVAKLIGIQKEEQVPSKVEDKITGIEKTNVNEYKAKEMGKELIICFKDEKLFQTALNIYIEKRDTWKLDDKIRLYELAKDAFNQNVSLQQREEKFKLMYDDLKSWQIFRKARHYLSYQELFSLLNTDTCQACSRERVTLLDWKNHYSVIAECIEKVKNIKIKPSGKYSVMAFSKFLHFFNPKLFPIFDQEYIGKKVLHNKHLDTVSDYLKFMESITDQFREIGNNLQDRMQYFREWFYKKWLQEPNRSFVTSQLEYISEYYPLLFDFISIGASMNQNRQIS